MAGTASRYGYELPTWFLLVLVYGAWLSLTAFFHRLPMWLSIPLAAWLVAWHGSLQHEATHGHPTRSPRLNAVLVGLPLWLWLPFGIYRNSHLEHHRTSELTDPTSDPESYWVSDPAWARSCPVRRALHWLNATLLGRLVLGPSIVCARLVAEELARLARGDLSHLRHWAWHIVGCALVVTWLWFCELPVAVYVLAFAYPGVSLTLVRSYAEHKPAAERAHRTAIIEANPLWSLLFLNNNLHAVHHDHPGLPWYRIPAEFRRRRADYLEANGNYLHRGYLEVARQFLLRPRLDPRYRRAGG
ncbi:MAG: fatty acid desaturase [Deltaproteobacteria bacterium]|nr:fatty acid desaturase [Deltaproteobacteria bacterium]